MEIRVEGRKGRGSEKGRREREKEGKWKRRQGRGARNTALTSPQLSLFSQFLHVPQDREWPELFSCPTE